MGGGAWLAGMHFSDFSFFIVGILYGFPVAVQVIPDSNELPSSTASPPTNASLYKSTSVSSSLTVQSLLFTQVMPS